MTWHCHHMSCWGILYTCTYFLWLWIIHNSDYIYYYPHQGVILLPHTFFWHIPSGSWMGLSNDSDWLYGSIELPAILLTWRRVLMANCPHKVECVNSQFVLCNAVPSGWTLCKCSGTLYALVQFWRLWRGLHYVMICIHIWHAVATIFYL